MPKHKRFFGKRKFYFLAAIFVLILGGLFLAGSANKAFAYSQGDVLINEFLVNPSSGNEWYEFLNTTDSDIDLAGWKLSSAIFGDMTISVLKGSASTILPAHGLLTVELGTNPANDSGDVLQIKDPTDQSIHAVSYGDQPNPPAPNHADAPGAGQSAVRTGEGLGSTWSVTTTPSQGWFNETVEYDCVHEPASPPTLGSIAACLSGITTNMANTSSIPDPSVAANLWFEKTGMGMISYNTALNLSDNNTRNLLQTLGEKMELAAGKVKLDASTAEMMKNAGATIYFYDVFNGLGYDDVGGIGTDAIVVRDDGGNIIPSDSPDYPEITNDDWNTDNGGTFWFDASHFSEYDIVPVLAEVTPVPLNVNTITPDFTFSSNVAGTYVFEGDCAGTGSGSTTIGNNTITLAELTEDMHSDCAVKVIDGAGSSSTLAMTPFRVDVTPPSGSITNISPGAYLRGTATIEASAGDSGSDVNRVEFYYDGNLIGSDDSAPYSADWDTTAVGDGGYSIYLIVYDNAGNFYDYSGESTAVTVDNTSPSVTALGDGTSDYVLPSTCPSVACDRGDIYGAALNFNEELDAASKTAVESAITAGASAAPRTYVWSGSRVRIYATESVTFNDDVTVASISDPAGNTTADVKLIDSKSSYIQDQIDAASPGDTINIPAGTYEENILVNKQVTLVGDAGDGSAGAGPNAPVIRSPASNRTVDILADGVVIKGFIIDNNGNGYPAARVAVNVASATLEDNEIINGYTGITIARGAHNNTVSNNKIYSNSSHGVFINNSEFNAISGNEIYSNGNNGIELPGGNNAGGNSFSNNNIHDNNDNGIHFGGDISTSGGNITIDYNTFEMNGRAGVYIGSGTTGIDIRHNTVSNNGQNERTTGIHVMSGAGITAHYNSILNDNIDVGAWNEDGDNALDATQNYWGDAAGPYDAASNTEGNIHTSISGNVKYSPWYGDSEMTSLKGVPVTDGDSKTYTIETEYSVTSSGYNLAIPAGTVVTGTLSWDGQINPPSLTTITNPPSESGYSTTMGIAVEIGFPSGKLLLSRAVRVTLPGEHGKRVGYTRPGESFTEITTICGENSQTWADTNLGTEGDCKIDSGLDLVVWTKHFTKFGTYTMTYTGGSGGGSGGTPIPVNIARITTVISTSCPQLAAGDMVKVAGKPAIYALNSKLEALYFPSGDEFKSWRPTYGGYESITQECFDSLRVPAAYPGAVNYRPGSYVVKRAASSQLYVVEPNNTLAKITPAAAAALYGKDYKVMTVADPFWPHYVNRGADVTTTIAHPGMLVKVGGTTYYIDAAGQLHELGPNGMSANGFQAQFVRNLTSSVLYGLSEGNVVDSAVVSLTDKTQSANW